LKGGDVVMVLNRFLQRGEPQVLFCDDGSEFASPPMDLWLIEME
jgi:putative transposase